MLKGCTWPARPFDLGLWHPASAQREKSQDSAGQAESGQRQEAGREGGRSGAAPGQRGQLVQVYGILRKSAGCHQKYLWALQSPL